MNPAPEILALLRERLAGLDPQDVEIIDDSALHAGHAGASGGGHFRLRVTSAAFAGKTRLAQHRLVLDAVGDLMHGSIHALGIETRVPK